MSLELQSLTWHRMFLIQIFLSWIGIVQCRSVFEFEIFNQSLPTCESQFEERIIQCLEMSVFYKSHKSGQPQRRYNNVFLQEIFLDLRCRQYKDTLQCVHNTLVFCPGVGQTHTVQNYLSQPWAIYANERCHINQHPSRDMRGRLLFISSHNNTVPEDLKSEREAKMHNSMYYHN